MSQTGHPHQSSQVSKRPNYKYLVFGFCLFLATIAATVVVLHIFIKPAGAPKISATTAPVKPTSIAPQTGFSWKSTIDPHAIPLGDGHVSTTPQVGVIKSCTISFRGGGAQHAGPWINQTASTWDATAKTAVQGTVSWPAVHYEATVAGSTRVLTTNDLPVNATTGIFPISRSDPAYQYDRNPNAIAVQNFTYNLPSNPQVAETPSCVGLGAIGILTNGILLFNGLDDAGRDAVAHETQDTCNGHPDGQQRYHYHSITSCITAKATGSSTLVGYAMDGFGIYVERDNKGNLPTNADLDACHGRTSAVEWDGQSVTMYHYDATLEYPYTVGCFKGKPVVTNTRPM